MSIVLLLAAVLGGYISLKYMLWKKRGTCNCDIDLTGKTVLITGANTGNVNFKIGILLSG